MIEKVRAYGKVNIGLHVVKKKKNGYHLLDMIMSEIDLFDEIEFFECDTIKVDMSPTICEEKDNLCYKVANYIKEKYSILKGIKIVIKKNIPSGAGLGGGSSDAAAVLKFLNKYWDLKLSARRLKKVGEIFGKDIPYFICGGLARVRGEGEKISKIKKKPKEKPIALIIPKEKISTKVVFNNFTNFKKSRIKELLKALMEEKMQKFVFNDLTSTTNSLTSGLITDIKEKLNAFNIGNTMTGTGTVVVAFCEGDIEVFKHHVVSAVGNDEKIEIVFTKLKF